MTLDYARTRRDAHPRLGKRIGDDWLAREAAKGRGGWHPFYDWLAAPSGHADSDTILDAIEAALSAPVHGSVVDRAKRLKADRSDFWSAVGELYMAAALAACGLTPTLGKPDVMVTNGHDTVDIELNAVHATHDLTQLQETIAGRLSGPGTAIIWCADETLKLDPDTLREIADRAIAVALNPAGVPLEEHPGALVAGESGREVVISDLIDPTLVRVFIVDGDPGYVATRSGTRTGLVDPWPELQRRLREKEPQLSGSACGIVAVEAGFSDSSAIIWGERAALGFDAPVLRAGPNIAGLLVYWLDLRYHRPWRAYFVPNAAASWPGAPLVEEILRCLGAKPLIAAAA